MRKRMWQPVSSSVSLSTYILFPIPLFSRSFSYSLSISALVDLNKPAELEALAS